MTHTRRSVLVTGASSGIGWETAHVLRQAGFRVFAGFRTASSEDKLRQNGLIPIFLDVTQPSSIQEAVHTICQSPNGRFLHAIVNNAGIAIGGPWEHTCIDAVRSVFEVNFFGNVLVTKAFLPCLRETKGRVVFISSIAAEIAAAFNGPYAASKSALESMVDSLRRELRPLGVPVVSILPGPVATPLWQKFRSSFPPMNECPSYATECDRYIDSTLEAEKHGSRASIVAAAVLKSLILRKPPARMILTPGGRLLLRLQSLLPESLQDYLMYMSAE